VIKVDLKGVHTVTTKRGRKKYRYAWRGGPLLCGEPGTREFVVSYNKAIESRKAVDTDRFRSVIVRYRSEPYSTFRPSSDAMHPIALLDCCDGSARVVAIQ
jgi:hypothetical protein